MKVTFACWNYFFATQATAREIAVTRMIPDAPTRTNAVLLWPALQHATWMGRRPFSAALLFLMDCVTTGQHPNPITRRPASHSFGQHKTTETRWTTLYYTNSDIHTILKQHVACSYHGLMLQWCVDGIPLSRMHSLYTQLSWARM